MAEVLPAEPRTVRVRYFAALIDLAGCDEESVSLPPGRATVAELWTLVIARHPALGPQRPFVRVAKNTDFVSDDAVLDAEDVVALLPPFSGG